MHSRIIQLEDAPTAKALWNDCKCYDNNEWFMSTIADYVCEDEDRDDTIDWLKGELKKSLGDKVTFFKDEDDLIGGVGFLFHEGFREVYFAERFEKFKSGLIDLANNVTMKRFCSNGMGGWMLSLNAIYEDEYSFYVDTDYFGLETLDSFIRHAKEDKPYYICATYDYHF